MYSGPFGPFPTLREMIDSGQRLVLMAENKADDISWYPSAYRKALQETPFTFKSAAKLTDPSRLPESCRSNRGPRSAPLFLVNNWVDTTPIPPRRYPPQERGCRDPPLPDLASATPECSLASEPTKPKRDSALSWAVPFRVGHGTGIDATGVRRGRALHQPVQCTEPAAAAGL